MPFRLYHILHFVFLHHHQPQNLHLRNPSPPPPACKGGLGVTFSPCILRRALSLPTSPGRQRQQAGVPRQRPGWATISALVALGRLRCALGVWIETLEPDIPYLAAMPSCEVASLDLNGWYMEKLWESFRAKFCPECPPPTLLMDYPNRIKLENPVFSR